MYSPRALVVRGETPLAGQDALHHARSRRRHRHPPEPSAATLFPGWRGRAADVLNLLTVFEKSLCPCSCTLWVQSKYGVGDGRTARPRRRVVVRPRPVQTPQRRVPSVLGPPPRRNGLGHPSRNEAQRCKRHQAFRAAWSLGYGTDQHSCHEAVTHHLCHVYSTLPGPRWQLFHCSSLPGWNQSVCIGLPPLLERP